jgi:hypothetical protein
MPVSLRVSWPEVETATRLRASLLQPGVTVSHTLSTLRTFRAPIAAGVILTCLPLRVNRANSSSLCFRSLAGVSNATRKGHEQRKPLCRRSQLL